MALQSELEKARREDALNRLLARRPLPKELQERHVMLATDIAPALQANQATVAKARLENQLSHKLAQRPTREELVEKHVMPGARICARGTSATRRTLNA